MFDVIVTGSVVFTGEEVIRDGYVYIKNGRIRDVGAQPVPEDYTYATLVLGGPHRIVLPGLAVVADVIAYPIRFKRPGILDRIEFYRSTPRRIQARLSLPGVYELHMRGVTTIIVESIDPSVVLDIESSAGGRYGVAVPACQDEVSVPLPSIRVSLPGCEGEGVSSSEIPYLAGRESYDLHGDWGVEGLWELNFSLRRRMGLPEGVLKRNILAEVAVFDARRPPLAFLEYSPERAAQAPLLAWGVESLIAGDEVIIDGGEHLNIVDKHLVDAVEEASKLLRVSDRGPHHDAV